MRYDRLIFVVITIAAVVMVAGCEEEDLEGIYCCPKCTDPDATLIKAPGGICKCWSPCPSSHPNLLAEWDGSACCVELDCSDTTPTTIPTENCELIYSDGYYFCDGECPNPYDVCSWYYEGEPRTNVPMGGIPLQVGMYGCACDEDCYKIVLQPGDDPYVRCGQGGCDTVGSYCYPADGGPFQPQQGGVKVPMSDCYCGGIV